MFCVDFSVFQTGICSDTVLLRSEPLVSKTEGNQFKLFRRAQTAFTLAELLISLAILGVIATFTIPKILGASQISQKNAIFKESIATIAGVVDMGLKSGELIPNTNGDTYFLTHLNALKICDTNSSMQGCWNTTIQGTPPNESNEPGVILHNGAVIVGFANTANPSQGILIDWNGLAGPNVSGDDQLLVGYCVQNTCGGSWLGGTGPRVPGSVGVSRLGTATDLALFQSIYQ